MERTQEVLAAEKVSLEKQRNAWFTEITIGEMVDPSTVVMFFGADIPFRQVMDYASRHAPDAVIILENGNAAGILTSKDILSGLQDSERLNDPVGTFMSTPLRVFGERDTVDSVLKRMEQTALHKIVVVDECRNICGIIDRRHLAAQLCQKLSPLIRHYDDDIRLLLDLAGERTESLLEMATTDPLTGIANRRLFSEIFRSHLAVNKRFGGPLFLILLDIDDFKHVNDTFGHNIGDRVLKELVGVISASIRAADVLARWGGEEFVILLHCTMEEGGKTMAENLRQRIDRHRFDTIGHLTCSFGVTGVPQHDSLESVIGVADKALYFVKKRGKNGVAYGKDGNVYFE